MRAQPLLETTRGGIVESVHYGSIAVVDSNGKLLASHGDPQAVAFLRSSAKPFQALPVVESGAVDHFGFTPRELAIACASHIGSDEHVKTVQGMHEKIGIEERYLQCGAHMPGESDVLRHMIINGEMPTPVRNNCSGKHTAMLAHAKMRGLSLDDYLNIDHPIQQDIIASFSDLCLIPSEEIQIGIDGCSAPNFAVPLYNAALGMARMCDPHALVQPRAEACRRIVSAMTSHADMVSGKGEFDCELMEAGEGKILCKGGAEGYQILGLLPGVLGVDSPGVGIAFKVSDGDASRVNMTTLGSSHRARPAVTLEILRQLGALSLKQEQALDRFGPVLSIQNHQGLLTGESRPAFTL